MWNRCRQEEKGAGDGPGPRDNWEQSTGFPASERALLSVRVQAHVCR